MDTPVTQAVQIAGGQSALAKAISRRHPNIKQQHVWKWVRADRIPAEYVLAVEEAVGISRHDLRQDVFGPAPDSSPNR